MPDLRIGHLSTFYHTSIILLANGFTGSLLRDAEWRMFGTGPEIVAAFERGGLDLAYVGLPPSMIGIDRGVKIKCVAGGHIEGTVISGKKHFRGYTENDRLDDILIQFVGLRIGVPGKGSIHDVILKEALDRLGLGDRIEVVNYAWADEITEAVARDELAAAVGTPALAVALKRFAGCKVLLPPSKIWPSNPSYGILANERFLRECADVVEGFLTMHEEATSILRGDPQEASRIISDYVRVVDREFVMETLGMSPKYCAQLTKAYIDSTMRFVAPMKKLGYIKRDLSAAEVFEPSLIRKVHPAGSHYEGGIRIEK